MLASSRKDHAMATRAVVTLMSQSLVCRKLKYTKRKDITSVEGAEPAQLSIVALD